MFCVAMPLCAQQKIKEAGKHGRIERVKENDYEVVRFFDKSGKKTREIQLKEDDLKIRISNKNAFKSSDLEIKISPTVESAIREMREMDNKRDVQLHRRISRDSWFNGNGRFLIVEEGYADFLRFADSKDGESSGEPTETESVITVYDQNGAKLLELPKSEGAVSVSNTGNFFVVTVGEYEKTKIMDKDKHSLAEFAFHGNYYFSETDRYILLVYFNPEENANDAALTVYDTKENKLELKKVILPWRIFASNKTPEINENTRTMIIRQSWNPKTKKAKEDVIRF